jgi:hypothetical protein
MDQEPQDTTSTCLVCGGSRWWRSRTGARVCQRCYPDAMEALQILAHRAQRACDAAIDDPEERLAPGDEG